MLETASMSEFMQHIEKRLNEFDEVDKLRESLRGFFINGRIANYVRDHIIKNETNRYHKNYKTRMDSEQCVDSSPYCFLKKSAQFNSDSQVIFRTGCILDNIKSKHFDIKAGNEQHAAKFAKKYTDDSFYDSLYRKRLFTAGSLIGTSDAGSGGLSNTLGLNSEQRISSTTSRIDASGYGSARTPSQKFQDSMMSHFFVADSAMLIMRESHVCQLKCDAMELQKRQDKRKRAFFDRSCKIINRYFGHKLKSHIERTAYKIKNSQKPSTNSLVKNQELRTSLQHNNRLKRSVRRRHCHSEEKAEPDRNNSADIVAMRRQYCLKFKSISSSINEHYGCYDCSSDSEDTDDSMEGMDVEYKITMDKAFLALDRRREKARGSSLERTN